MMKLTTLELNGMAEQVGKANHRWWIDLHTQAALDRNVGEMCMLIVSELSEAMEGHRKDQMDDKLPHRKMVEVELVDCLIRLLDMAWHLLPARSLHAVDYHGWRTHNFGENLLKITREILFLYQEPSYPAAYIRPINMILELMAAEAMDILGAYDDKMAYNAQRKDHTREGRLAAGGKKY